METEKQSSAPNENSSKPQPSAGIHSCISAPIKALFKAPFVSRHTCSAADQEQSAYSEIHDVSSLCD
eukprot:4879521-Amphidinium_carterae.1